MEIKVVAGDPKKHDLPGLSEALAGADLLLLSARRQALPEQQIAAVRNHLALGKALIGMRTASHAFDARGEGPKGHVEWPAFDPEVLGGHYTGHHHAGQKPVVKAAPGADRHPILAGV